MKAWFFPPSVLLCLSFGLCQTSFAERGFVLVQVEDTARRPVRGLEIGIEGTGGSKITGDDGKAQLPVGNAAKENDWLSLTILHAAAGQDFAMISPWDSRVQVPSFEDKPENFVRIIVVRRGDRVALEDGTVLASLTAKINKANAPKSLNEKTTPQDPKASLTAVAGQYGLSAEDVDHAIRAWGTKTSDPYEAGLAALYERNFDKASSQLTDSLRQREAKLIADQKLLSDDGKQVADAASFLGVSFFQQGNYRQSALAYEDCLRVRGDDPMVMNNTAMSLEYAGDYADAEPLYRRSLEIREKTLDPGSPDLATSLNNLAMLLYEKGDFAGAEPLYRRGLAIREKALGPDNPDVANSLSNLAELLRGEGRYTEAEPLLRRALEIDEKIPNADNLDLATHLNNLALLLAYRDDYADAEPLYRRSLAIREKVQGPDHPDVANSLNNLGLLLQRKGDFAAAEPLERRALDIDEKALGPDHPGVATDLNNLAELLQSKHDYAGAEQLFLRALHIREKALGPNHTQVANSLTNLAGLHQTAGDFKAAEPLFRQALEIDEKVFGSDNPAVAMDLNNLAELLDVEGDRVGAEPLLRKALQIDQATLGPDHPSTQLIQHNLNALVNPSAKAASTRPKVN